MIDRQSELIATIIHQVEKVIIGKREAVEKALIACLCGGHVLLEDVPGVGKTMLARALSETVNCTMKRIQFTPDLLPSDITGVSVFNQKTAHFEFRPGPIMANIVLVDEINRASPKTQAALLEAMEEKQITVDGEMHVLPQPFLVIATQNPLDFEGTFALPEAQLDRFLMCIRLGYPSASQETEMLTRLQTRHPIEQVKAVVTGEQLIALQQLVQSVYIESSLREYIVHVVQASRRHPDLQLGASPRSSAALMRTAQAKAFVSGRNYVVPDDIKAMAHNVLCHRFILKREARMMQRTAREILEAILAAVPVPNWRQAAGG